MARRFGRKKSRSTYKPSLLSMAPVAMLGITMYNGYKAGGLDDAVGYGLRATTGWSKSENKWAPNDVTYGFYGTVAATYVAKKLVKMSGVNRSLKGLPFRL